jgi:hypothetical protein
LSKRCSTQLVRQKFLATTTLITSPAHAERSCQQRKSARGATLAKSDQALWLEDIDKAQERFRFPRQPKNPPRQDRANISFKTPSSCRALGGFAGHSTIGQWVKGRTIASLDNEQWKFASSPFPEALMRAQRISSRHVVGLICASGRRGRMS